MLTTGIFCPAKLTKAQQTSSGVVTIAFDDGDQDQYNYAYPLLQQYGMAGTFYVITGFLGTSGYMTVPELQTMQANGSEIGSHSVDHPDFTQISDSQINEECNESQQFLQSNGLSAVNFAYPYGDANSHTDSIVLQYYRSARYSYQSNWLNPISPSTDIPMGFAGEAASVTTALSQDEAAVDQAIATNSWVIIFFHHVVPAANVASYLPYGIDTTDFSTLLSYIANARVASGLKVLTINQALNLGSIYPPSTSNKVVVSPSSPNMDTGQSETFAASAWGGTSPYKYHWYFNGQNVGANSPNFTFDSSSVGSFPLYVNVTDSSKTPLTIESRTLTIQVNSALATPTLSIDLDTVDQGQTSTLTSTDITGTGTNPYTYQWMQKAPGDSSFSTINNANSPSYNFVTDSATTTGAWNFKLQVTDSADSPSTTTSKAVTVTVSPALATPTAYASLGTIDQGQTSSLTSTDITQTGTSPYTYQWMQQSPGDYSFSIINNAKTNNYDFVTDDDTATGTWNFELQVTDSADSPVTLISNEVTVVVNPTLSTPAINANSGSVDQGQTSTLTSTDITGTGTNPYTYQWMQKAPGDSSFSTINNANSPSYNFVTDSATTTGAWNFKLQVTDSADSPSTTTSKAVTVTVSPALATPTAYASLGTIDQGQTSSLTSTDITQTGTSPYTYQWMQQSPGDGSYYAISKAISSNYSFETSGSTITGSWSFELQVTDSVGTVVNSSPVTIMVSSALVAPTVSASADTLDQGQTSTLSSTDISTGTSLYTYQWFAKALGDGSYSAMSDASAPSYYFDTSKSTTTGAWSFMLQVTDATGVAVNSTAVVVTVNTAPAVNVSPTSQTIYVGQSQTLTATASYGSSDLTYQWYLNNNPIGTNSSTYNYTPDNAGSASIYVILIDSATNPQTATSNTAKIIINALTITTTAGTGGTITPSGIVICQLW